MAKLEIAAAIEADAGESLPDLRRAFAKAKALFANITAAK